MKGALLNSLEEEDGCHEEGEEGKQHEGSSDVNEFSQEVLVVAGVYPNQGSVDNIGEKDKQQHHSSEVKHWGIESTSSYGVMGIVPEEYFNSGNIYNPLMITEQIPECRRKAQR